MANFFSNVLTTRDSKGGISNSPAVTGGVNISSAVLKMTEVPIFADNFYLIDLPSSAVILTIRYYNEQLDTGGSMRLGTVVYAGAKFVEKDGTVVEKNDLISSASLFLLYDGVQSNNLPEGSNVRYDPVIAEFELPNHLKSLWELSGLQQDPFINLRLGFDVISIPTVFVPGNILMVVEWQNKH